MTLGTLEEHALLEKYFATSTSEGEGVDGRAPALMIFFSSSVTGGGASLGAEVLLPIFTQSKKISNERIGL